jgi:hypothetical protein
MEVPTLVEQAADVFVHFLRACQRSEVLIN